MVILLVKWCDVAFIVWICGGILDLLKVNVGEEVEDVADVVEDVPCVLNGSDWSRDEGVGINVEHL